MQKLLYVYARYVSLLSASFLLSTAGVCADKPNPDELMPAPGAAAATGKQLPAGYYVGLDLGYDFYRFRQNGAFTKVGGVPVVALRPALMASGFEGGFFGGYSAYLDNLYYLGGEVFINNSNANTNYTTNIGSLVYYTTVSVGSTYGVSLLPGIKLNDSTLLYTRFGYTRADLKGKESLTAGGVNVSDGNTAWKSGFTFGVGLETAVYGNFSLRGEYAHTNYVSLLLPSGSTFDISNNAFMLNAIYHFA